MNSARSFYITLTAVFLGFAAAYCQNFQTVEEVDQGCASLGFSGDLQAEKIVDDIIDAIGLKRRNFVIQQCPEINNAVAMNLVGPTGEMERFILYDKDFFTRIEEKASNDWASTSILAHEIGHHLSAHTLSNKGSNHKWELEADYFCGQAIARIGGTLEDAQSAVKTLPYDKATRTHPAKADRLKEIEKGWRKGKGLDTELTREEKLEELARLHYQNGTLSYDLNDYKVAFDHFQKATALGYEDAYFYMALMKMQGIGVKADFEKGYEYARKGHELGSIPSTYVLASFYQNANGSLRNREEAERLFKKNFQLQWFLDEYEKTNLHLLGQIIGTFYFKGYGGAKKDWDKALNYFEKAARGGDPMAQLTLSSQYRSGGFIVEKATGKALYWLQKAAEGGYAHAQDQMGVRYEYGDGVEQNLEVAANWYKKSADQEFPAGMANYGYALMYGKGVEQDIEAGSELCYEAAKRGSRWAQYYLGEAFMKGEIFDQDYERARYFMEYAARNGVRTAQYEMANMLELGLGGDVDLPAAIQWYRMAAQEGHKKSQEALKHLGKEW